MNYNNDIISFRQEMRKIFESAYEAVCSLRQFANANVVKVKTGEDAAFSFDISFEKEMIRVCRETLSSFEILSEEAGFLRFGESPRFRVILDPVDGSAMLARGMPLSSSAVAIQRIPENTTICAMILDHASGCIYDVDENNITLPSGSLSEVKDVNKAFIVSYAAKKERVSYIRDHIGLFSEAHIFLNYGGPMDLAKIAVGRVDAVIETFKGFKAYDLLAGMYILERQGGVIIDEFGERLRTSEIFYKGRTKFIAAGTYELAMNIFTRLKK